ncbi:MAG TPA: glycosyltransferase family protein [bacterium]|nr:glycosyltransferase family protein [bacterium]
MKTVAIIQARMGSTRLPGKVLKSILGTPSLEHMMKRVARCKTLDEIVIATTVHSRDDRICEFAEDRGYLFGRGSENDVLDRYYQIARERNADAVVRMTSDCPLIDPEISDRVIQRHLEARTNDLTSNVFRKLTFPNGFDTEVISFTCLERMHRETQDPLYREHVTNYIHDFPEKFAIENVADTQDHSDLRLCVDTEEDFRLVSLIFETLHPNNADFGYREIFELFKQRPELKEINSEVRQTKILKRQAAQYH